MRSGEFALVMLIIVASAVVVGYSLGEAAGSQTVPMAVVPRDSTVIIYRTIERARPKPDTSLRYICKETK